MANQLEIVKTQFHLPEDVHQKLKELSRESGLPMVQIMAILVRRADIDSLPKDVIRRMVYENML